MSTNRETARDALAALLTTALVGVGLPVKTVTNSNVKELEGLTPLVGVLSGGTLRERLSFQGDKATFYLEVQVFVLQAGTGWTNAQAEDALDRIESLIAGVYESNRGTANWAVLEYDGRSTVIEVTADGKLYFMEIIPTVVRTTKS